jgi:vacuolar-type H+-ATPase subunit I/STV1
MLDRLRKLITILEARQGDNPDVSYELAGKTKKATAAGEFDNITATVTGRTSEKFTKIAKKLSEINDLNKKIKELQAETNDMAKEQMANLFDKEDTALTRYIKTVSIAVTLSKVTPATTTTSSSLDIDGLLESIFAALDEDLHPVIRTLVEQHTKIIDKTSTPRSPSITMKVNESNSGISNLISRLVSWAQRRLVSYDAKIDKIQQAIDNA